MNTKTKTLAALLALGAPALITNAQDENNPRPGGPRMQGPPPPLVHALDANHDGTIDANEIANASAALKTLDKNGDGALTREELRPQRPEGGEGQNEQRPPRQDGQGRPGMRQQQGPGPMLAVLDANKDGTIDATEISKAGSALLALDKNDDGQLTREELRPPRPEGGEGRGDGQRPPRGPRPPQDQNQ
ncbi:MAG TPA: hypothetical protein PKA41_04715 [Verrucomicrobiota bacterium]|nr:hypothetical protein [Verrucomicrobiota bacterium]